MENEKRENIEEVNVDIKGTIAKIIKTEEPELTQEEAIQKYTEGTVKNKKISTSSEDEENSEEVEHLNRIKKELLASLERVKQLAKKIYSDEKKVKKESLKVKENAQKVKGRSMSNDESIQEQKESLEAQVEQERE